MIYEENQPENTAYQPDNALEAIEEIPAEASSPLEGEKVLELEPQSAQPATAPPQPAATPATEGQQVALEALIMETEALKAQLEASNSQSEALKAQYARIVADFDNFRRRTQREKEEFEEQIKCNTITELLPVVDNFERARSHLNPQTDSAQTIHKSYQSVYKQLVDSLKRLGVSPMRPEGKEFDPNLHEAVMREPTNEYPEGTVIEELVRGYFLGDRVVRHSMVKVAAAAEPVITSEEIHPDSPES